MSLLREVFKREDLPAATPAPGAPALLQPSEAPEEKKRQYSISGWVRGEDGAFRRDGSIIRRKGKIWIRETPVDGVMQLDSTYQNLHDAIKGAVQDDAAELKSGGPLLEDYSAVDGEQA